MAFRLGNVVVALSLVFTTSCVASQGTSTSSSASSAATGGAGGTQAMGGAGGATTSSTSATAANTATATTSTGGACAHDVCVLGSALTSTCSACAMSVCATDPFCCGAMGGSWDATCLAEAGGICGAPCGAGPCTADTCPFGCCDATNQCHEDGCQFYGVACGGDMTMGGSTCQYCEGGTSCETCTTVNNVQMCGACVPNCTGKQCGTPDGCGSRCDGTCGAGEFCSISLGTCTNVCDTNSCRNGCCDASGKCQPGVTDASCGWLGSPCQVCPASNPSCIPIPTAPSGPMMLPSPPEGGKCQACDSTTCPTGCCSADGHCITTEHDPACGRYGASCIDCTTQGSVCTDDSCAECVPHCAGQACGASDGCGSVCSGPCAAGTFCLTKSPVVASGCVACGPDTCPEGCCSAAGQCVSGGDRNACGTGGQACADCGAGACVSTFSMGQFTNSCGACGAACAQNPGACMSDGCGSVCPGGTCMGGALCTVDGSGHATCQQNQGFCDPFSCDGCCDYSMGFGGTCVPGNLPTKCGSNAIGCVDCIAMGETCDTTTHKCAGCTGATCASAPGKCGYSDGCGGVCNAAEGATCTGGANCDANGKCTCPGIGQDLCGGQCIDVFSAATNCGGCGVICPTGVACVGGTCQCPAPNAHFCAENPPGVCTNLATDSAHCGTCYTACPGTPCNDGVCGTCPTGATACSGACAVLSTDSAHCGDCTNACPTGISCVNGKCPCGNGQFACNGTCTDLMTDANHCGDCDKACPTGTTCAAGQCQCPGGTTLCNFTCTNVAVDPANCGGCNMPCQPGHACVSGQCQ